MKGAWEEFRLAGAFLTLFPVAGGLSFEPARLGRCMAFFPAVGLVLGLGLVVLDHALSPIFPRGVADALLILALIGATGGLHLDGLADLTDGLAGGRDREGALRIMKDSRVGAMGAIALVMILLLRYLSLFHLPLTAKPAALIFMPAAGRWAQVALAVSCPYVRPGGGTGAVFVEHVGWRELLIASATIVLAAAVLFGLQALPVLAGVGALFYLLSRYFRRRLGGVTGDVLGGATEVMEVFILLLLLALAGAAEAQ